MDRGKVVKANLEAKIKEMNEKIKSLKHKNKVMASLGAKDIDFMRNLQEIAYLKLKVIEYTILRKATFFFTEEEAKAEVERRWRK